MSEYDVKLTASAFRGLETVPARVAEPLVSFIFGGLAAAPRRRGKPLRGQLDGWWAARRGEDRVIYRIDDPTMTMYVLRTRAEGRSTGRGSASSPGSNRAAGAAAHNAVQILLLRRMERFQCRQGSRAKVTATLGRL